MPYEATRDDDEILIRLGGGDSPAPLTSEPQAAVPAAIPQETSAKPVDTPKGEWVQTLDTEDFPVDAAALTGTAEANLTAAAQMTAETDDSFSDRLSSAGQELGLTVHVCPQSADTSTRRGGVPFQLRVYAMDQPGIVHRITHVLHEHGVNVEELQTRLEPGSYTGTPLFTMSLHMTVPADGIGPRPRSTGLDAPRLSLAPGWIRRPARSGFGP